MQPFNEGPLEGQYFFTLQSTSESVEPYPMDSVFVTREMNVFLNLSAFDSCSDGEQDVGTSTPNIEPCAAPVPVPSSSSSTPTVSLSAGSQPASSPSSNIPDGPRKKVTKRGIPPKPRSRYDVNPVFDFMWENVAMSHHKTVHTGPGKHGVKILDHFGNLEAAKEHLARSITARKLFNAKKDPETRGDEARRQRDKRRDFFCFMPGCGLCFERGDKLERHLIETNVHGTIKPLICPHRNCHKSFVDNVVFCKHAEAHMAAGHGECLLPYPWNCPYPSVVEGLKRAFAALSTSYCNDSIEV